jgi:hypothetical protein
MNNVPVTIAAVRAAAAGVLAEIAGTPAIAAFALCELADAEMHLKLETLHLTGSFKERGADQAADTRRRSEARRGRSNVCRQQYPHHARRLSVPAPIVMAKVTPLSRLTAPKLSGRLYCRRATVSPVPARPPIALLASGGSCSSIPMLIPMSSLARGQLDSSSSLTGRISFVSQCIGCCVEKIRVCRGDRGQRAGPADPPYYQGAAIR